MHDKCKPQFRIKLLEDIQDRVEEGREGGQACTEGGQEWKAAEKTLGGTEEGEEAGEGLVHPVLEFQNLESPSVLLLLLAMLLPLLAMLQGGRKGGRGSSGSEGNLVM